MAKEILRTIKFVPDFSEVDEGMKKYSTATLGGGKGGGGAAMGAAMASAVLPGIGAFLGTALGGLDVTNKLLSGILEGFKGVGMVLTMIGKMLGMMVMPFANLLIPMLLPLLYFLTPVAKQLNVMLKPLFDAMMKNASGTKSQTEVLGGLVGAKLGPSAQMGFESTYGALNQGMPTLENLTKMWGLVTSAFELLMKALAGIISMWRITLGRSLESVFLALAQGWGLLNIVVKGMWDTFTAALRLDFPGVITAITNFTDALIGWVQSCVTEWASFFTDWNTMISDFFSQFGINLTDMTTKTNTSITSLATGITGALDGIRNAITNALNSIRDWFNGLMDKVGLGKGAAPSSGGDILGSIISGISGMVPHFQGGGVVQNTGLAYVHAGETVVPAGGGGIEINMPINLAGSGGLTQDQINRIMREIETRLQSKKIGAGGFG